VVAVPIFDKLHIDDPVGAISVHGVCGLWGTLAVGLFSTNPEHTLLKQLCGGGAYGVVAFGVSLSVFWILKMLVGLRVPRDEELMGLDLGEHSQEAYHGFQVWLTN